MLTTVVFFLFSRYRLPAVPALMLLAAVPLARVNRKGILAVLVVLLLPHLAGFQPRLDLVHYNLGRIEDERGNPDAARTAHREAMRVVDECGDDGATAQAFRSLALQRSESNDPMSAIELLEKVRAIHEARGDLAAQADCWTMIGSELGGPVGRNAEARAAYERAADLARRAQRTDLEARATMAIGNTWKNLGRPDKGLDFLERARRMEEELGNEHEAGVALNGIADIHNMMGRDRDAVGRAMLGAA
jgi:hypothetical protein